MARLAHVCLLGAALSLVSCTDRSLYGKLGQEPLLADKLTVTGVLCTDNPATRKFPVKILFIVDGSGPMAEAAPLAEHVTAIEQTISQFLPINNVFVGVIRYDTNATSLISEQMGRITSGFSRDDALIDGAVAALRNAAGARDLASAMSLAESIITGDAFQAELGPLSRTKYVVVHVTNGSPAPPITPDRCRDLFDVQPPNCEVAFFTKAVRDIRDTVLDLGAAEFAFHTVHLEQAHVEGAPCDPRDPMPTCMAGTACVQAGGRADVGRCVEFCDPNAPACVTDPLRTTCAVTDLPDGTTINFCARDELDCFDGVDNDRDGTVMDCADPAYPYNCNNGMCETSCRSSCRAETLGLSMSLAAGGRYERFASADQINFAHIDFRSTQRLFVLKEFLVYNRNAIPTLNGFEPDSDADGLSDAEEALIAGLDPLNADTDFDFFNDKLEHLLRPLGMDPVAPNVLDDCEDPTLDTDGDGLRDCEERLLASDRTLFDTDADGFPDGIEFRAGTNIIFNDNLEDLDIDGVNNGREIRAHTDAASNDATVRAELAYRYRTTDLGPTMDLRSCYDMRVSNITLVDTLDRGFGPGNNDIDIYFGQVPDGDLEGYGIFHVAQLRIQYLPPDVRIPDVAAVQLQETDFATFEQ
ncbi:MAG: hypothetical protein RIT81_19110 [Deltaproteobacteria bacterium]